MAQAPGVDAALRKFDLAVTQGDLDPDCWGTAYKALSINGQFPGPALTVTMGDDVEVNVRNKADVATSIHFHGIRQQGSPGSDGVPGITQSMISPGEQFTYKFRVQQSGTYFYHAHSGNQDDTVQGAFIVQEPHGGMPYEYDAEMTVHLSEWWHQAPAEREAYYMGPNFRFDPSSDSILLNGHTVHNASLPASTAPSCRGYASLDVQPNHTYRLRVIGGNTFRTLGFGIKNHNMTIVEVDGELIKQHITDHLEVTPGQRFSVLLRTGDYPPDSLFPMATQYRYRHAAEGLTENGFGYLRYKDQKNGAELVTQGTPKVEHVGFPDIPAPAARDWIWKELKPLAQRDPMLDKKPSRTLVIRSWAKEQHDNSTRYTMNDRLTPVMARMETGKPMVKMAADDPMPILQELQRLHRRNQPPKFKIEEDGYEGQFGTYPLSHNEVVDIVFQNAKHGRNCLLHPWHTHGHSHYVIATGDGEYDPVKDKDTVTYANPIFKDVSTAYASDVDEKTQGCGWTKIRMRADNPGVWAVHCHITSHMLQGKLIVLQEAPERIEKSLLY
ncbi:multicopper oxidase-domain-containing protein [Gongronella butleri]|nr:multicopper oxidase-domain-containing protein [Gongronella butleri]